MTAPHNFRSAFNGFNREDVAQYLEYIHKKHQTQINQLRSELEQLRAQQEQPQEDSAAVIAQLEQQCAALAAQLAQVQQPAPAEDASGLVAALQAECAALTAQLEQKSQPDQAVQEDPSELIASLQEECASLTSQLEEAECEKAALEAKCAELEQQLEDALNREAPAAPVAEELPLSLSDIEREELEAYRRAERIEREARERSAQVYTSTSGALNQASATVEDISGEIADVADQMLQQLNRLQTTVGSGKQALQTATDLIETIRPVKQ